MNRNVIAGIMCLCLVLSSAASAGAAGRSPENIETNDRNIIAQSACAEGEALAIIRGDDQPQVSGQTELLAEVSPDAVKAVVEEWKNSGSNAAEELRQRSESLQTREEDSFSIWCVTDQDKTTEQILQDLYADPNVIAAEPNYLAYAAEEQKEEEKSTEKSDDASTAGEAAPAEEPDSRDGRTKGDLSPMQWYTCTPEDGAATYTTPLSPTGGYSLEVPGWQEGRTNGDAPANASGTICVMDTGIDTEHPDLQGVLYEFTPEQQARYGCGKYGYNASGDGRPVTEQKAVTAHGTHVAGIIAANWNGDGTSGIAHGVKIFSVNVFGGNGELQEMKSVIKGFQFLIDCAQEVNLKAVNCSWGTVQPEFILSTMVEELGRKGVNTVIAAGNRYCDLDESIDLGSLIHSEYAIVVDAASMDGRLTDFSCWGQDSSDVLAPGGSILSTVAQDIQDMMGAEVFSHEDNTRFYPEVTAPEHLLSGIERFEGENPGVRFFDQNPALREKAKEIGEINSQNGYDDKRTAAVRLSALRKEETGPGGYAAVNGYVYMAIPVTNAEEAKWISVKAAISDGFKPGGGIDSVTFAGADGKPVEVARTASNVLKKGLGTGASYHIYQCQWAPLSYNVDGFLAASNELHEMIQGGLSEEERREKGLENYTDPGEITGLYGWEDREQTYVIARIGIGEVTADSRSLEVSPDTSLYIDNVAVGDKHAYTGAYGIMSGTSMAAPTVTGCLGVIARDEPESASLTEAELEEAARERAAKLLASVDYDESLSQICRTGGRVNLHGQTKFVRKAPLIKRTVAEDQVLKLEGWYFGKEGAIAIDGTEVEVQTREDQKIEIPVASLPNGSHVVTVTNEDGAVNRAVFSLSSEEAEGRRLFEKSHSVPVKDPLFIEDHCDRLYGSIAVSGGKLYTMALSAKYKDVQGFWGYDIAQDSWSRIALPEDFAAQSLPDTSFVSLNDRLYLFGFRNDVDEEGEKVSRPCLWRYEPYGDFWEKLEILMPNGAGGICVLHGELFAVDGNVYGEDLGGAQLEGDAPDEDGGYTSGFYKVDLTGGALIRVKGELPDGFSSVNMKLTCSKDKLYIYAQDDTSGLEQEEGQEDAPVEKTVSEGKLLRYTYDAAENRMTLEADLTDTFNQVLGKDLRVEYDYKKGAEIPGEHFAIAGLDDGVAIIGSSSLGEDVHIIRDTEKEAVLFDRATCYHMAYDPIAVYRDGTLYVIGYSTTEPEVMYFRSQRMDAETPQNAGGTGEEAGQPGSDPRVIGGVTIGLFAAVVLVLTTMRKKKEE